MAVGYVTNSFEQVKEFLLGRTDLTLSLHLLWYPYIIYSTLGEHG